MSMLARFSAYGFLKNQRYFEPFLILAFLAKGLTFFQIGLLVGFREVCVNIMEVPSGAVADLYGRRRCMMLSFGAYIASFVLFGSSDVLWHLFLAMLLYAVGDAFRTGTHKAMIFEWLRQQGRTSERTRIYGYTRSWSKLGSAAAALLAAVFVLWSGDYETVFWLSIPPYALNLLNFAFYPKSLDGDLPVSGPRRGVRRHLLQALGSAIRRPRLRRLMVESMSFEGVHKASRDYLQPILRQAALALPLLVTLEGNRRAAVLVGGVYCLSNLLASRASRGAHRLVERSGGEDSAAHRLWWGAALLYAILLPSLGWRWWPMAVLAFLALEVLQNIWRPVLISRFDACSEPGQGATILSIESQSKSAATALVAPLLGLAVDAWGFWPVGALGLVTASAMAVTARPGPDAPPRP